MDVNHFGTFWFDLWAGYQEFKDNRNKIQTESWNSLSKFLQMKDDVSIADKIIETDEWIEK